MENSLKLNIGREPKGELVYVVPETYASVSRNHAELYMNDGDFYIVDKSSNGTLLNGIRIKKSKIKEGDEIVFGSPEGGYPIDYEKAVTLYNNTILEAKTDFSEEFNQLKDVYDEYEKKKNQIVKNSKISGVLPRIILSILMIAAIYFIPIPADLKYPMIMGVGIIGMALSVMSKSDQKMKKKLEDLIIKYNRKYVCPKCNNKLNIQSKSYKMLLEDGKCPYKSCDAIYKTV